MPQSVFFWIKNKKIINTKVVAEAFNKLQDGRYKLQIASANKRSNNQNAYFHGVVLDIVRQGLQEAGYDEVKTLDDAKTVVKALFLKDKIINKETGEVLTEYIRDTGSLTTIEFMTFIDEIVRWSAEYLGVTIPLPGAPVTMF